MTNNKRKVISIMGAVAALFMALAVLFTIPRPLVVKADNLPVLSNEEFALKCFKPKSGDDFFQNYLIIPNYGATYDIDTEQNILADFGFMKIAEDLKIYLEVGNAPISDASHTVTFSLKNKEYILIKDFKDGNIDTQTFVEDFGRTDVDTTIPANTYFSSQTLLFDNYINHYGSLSSGTFAGWELVAAKNGDTVGGKYLISTNNENGENEICTLNSSNPALTFGWLCSAGWDVFTDPDGINSYSLGEPSNVSEIKAVTGLIIDLCIYIPESAEYDFATVDLDTGDVISTTSGTVDYTSVTISNVIDGTYFLQPGPFLSLSDIATETLPSTVGWQTETIKSALNDGLNSATDLCGKFLVLPTENSKAGILSNNNGFYLKSVEDYDFLIFYNNNNDEALAKLSPVSGTDKLRIMADLDIESAYRIYYIPQTFSLSGLWSSSSTIDNFVVYTNTLLGGTSDVYALTAHAPVPDNPGTSDSGKTDGKNGNVGSSDLLSSLDMQSDNFIPLIGGLVLVVVVVAIFAGLFGNKKKRK